MKTISASFDPRSFVIGISNYTLHHSRWSWTVYLGPLFVQVNILKPRRVRRANERAYSAMRDEAFRNADLKARFPLGMPPLRK